MKSMIRTCSSCDPARPKPHRHCAAAVGIARRIDPVEQLEVALTGEVRECLSNRLADPFVAAEQAPVRIVDERDPVLRSVHDDRETGGLGEDLALPDDLFLALLDRQHGLGRLRADHQHAAHFAGRIRVVQGAVAVGPVHVLQLAIAGDGDELVFVPGGAATGHHLLDLRTDDRPDFGPHLGAGPAERRGMALRANRAAIGVVVEAEQRGAPPDVHRVAAVEDQADADPQRLRPLLRRPERRLRPIVRPDERAHLAAAQKEAQIIALR